MTLSLLTTRRFGWLDASITCGDEIHAMDLLELLFPAQCIGCGNFGSALCLSCLPDRPPCMRRVENLDVLALGYYDGPLRRAVLAIKRGRRDILASLAGRLGKLVVPNELLVGVPTTQIRRYRRGFDGGVLLASRVAMHASTRSVELLRSLQNGAQQGRTGLQRRASVGRFSVRMKENTPSTVTLIDDVCTTGTTLYDCATALARVDILVTRALTLAMVA